MTHTVLQRLVVRCSCGCCVALYIYIDTALCEHNGGLYVCGKQLLAAVASPTDSLHVIQ